MALSADNWIALATGTLAFTAALAGSIMRISTTPTKHVHAALGAYALGGVMAVICIVFAFRSTESRSNDSASDQTTTQTTISTSVGTTTSVSNAPAVHKKGSCYKVYWEPVHLDADPDKVQLDWDLPSKSVTCATSEATLKLTDVRSDSPCPDAATVTFKTDGNVYCFKHIWHKDDCVLTYTTAKESTMWFATLAPDCKLKAPLKGYAAKHLSYVGPNRTNSACGYTWKAKEDPLQYICTALE